MRRGRGAALLCALFVGLGAVSCATPIGVRQIRPAEAERLLTASVLSNREPSTWSTQFLVRLGLDLVRLEVRSAFGTVMKQMPTSIDNMSPKDPFIETLVSLPVTDGVAAHSIIAVQGSDEPPAGTDGVVAYRSAHFEPVRSELVVRSGHSTQGAPATIEEVRRILYEHLGVGPGGAEVAATAPAVSALVGGSAGQ